MDAKTAVDLINNGITYKPEWTIRAEDYTKRFENGIRLEVLFNIHDTSPACAEQGWPESCKFLNVVHFNLMVGKLKTPLELYRVLLGILLEIETHEAREFLKLTADNESPFHPHTDEGIRNWYCLDGTLPSYYLSDLTYGK